MIPRTIPLNLTDAQLATVMDLARPLAPWQRGPFLKAVARRLSGREIGDGSVHAAALEAVREVIESKNYRNVG
jgi:hypothetical protein